MVKVDDVFGRLIVVGLEGSHAICRCSCGTTKKIFAGSLQRGSTKSCGCLRREVGGRDPTHGMSASPEYRAWSSLIQRCGNPNDRSYENYGGRGLQVHLPWKRDFSLFLKEVGPRPSEAHSLDRKDNSLGYVPGNVRWATGAQQSRNKRTSRMLTFQGRTQCLTDWATELGISKKTLHQRLTDGMSVERALTQTLQKQDRRT
jgi:hypothetical protein